MQLSSASASIGHASVQRFGVFELDRQARELRKQGRRMRLQEQPYQVLAMLLERAGEAVTRDELRQKLWPSSVYVDFDHGLNNAIARLREALGDEAATPHFIETLPRLGYRFIYPIADSQASTGTSMPGGPATAGLESDAVTPSATMDTPRWTWRGALVATAVIAVAVISILRSDPWRVTAPVDETRPETAIPQVPSIAVLPFVNLGSEPDSGHFAVGLTGELLGKLSSIRGLRVVGGTSTSHVGGKSESLPAIAQALKVNHILEGSVRRSGARLHISAKLIDVKAGTDLWSQDFERDPKEIFQIQEDIALAIASALRVKLVEGDQYRLRKRGTQDAEAYRIYMIANAHMRGLTVKRDVATAKELYEQAIARDSQFAAAYAGLARYYFYRAWHSQRDADHDISSGVAAAESALALDPESSEALQARANFQFWRYRYLGDYQAYTDAHAGFRRALQLDPANQTAHFDYGRTQLWHDAELAQAMFERVVELEPLALPAQAMGALALSVRGSHDAARQRFQELEEQVFCCEGRYAVFRAGFELNLGRLDLAVELMHDALVLDTGQLPMHLWGLYLSLGDYDAAGKALSLGSTAPLVEAATLTMQGRYDDAFRLLDSRRREYERSRLLDLPAARLALITGKSAQALAILSRRLPDLAAGIEPVNGRNVIPALDLAAAWAGTGRPALSRQLLARIAAFLDGPAAPRLPIFVYQRARAHALSGERELALQALDRAYVAGFRTIWALDLIPQSMGYVDSIEVDPALAGLRSEPGYRSWLVRIKADNARQLERLRARVTATPAA